ncbi:MAG: hypothetical protein M3308_01595 [Actinomycetota bacterium]|nr:hypothetical protein [Actinomycetota bacterium]
MNASVGPRTTPVTSVADGRSHRVTDDAYAAGWAARNGRYVALCGHRVVAAALVCPPGPDCYGCAAAAGVRLRIGRGRHRHSTHPGRRRGRAR